MRTRTNILDKAVNRCLEYEKRQQRIMDTAIRLFNEKGYNAVRTAEICKMAGVSEPTLYSHFKSKKDLYITCSKLVISELNEMYRGIYEQYKDDEAQWLIEVTKAYVNFVDSNPDKSMFLVQLSILKSDPDFYQIIWEFTDRNIQIVRKMLRKAQAKRLINVETNVDSLAVVYTNLYFTCSATREYSDREKMRSEFFSDLVKNIIGMK